MEMSKGSTIEHGASLIDYNGPWSMVLKNRRIKGRNVTRAFKYFQTKEKFNTSSSKCWTLLKGLVGK